jgi:hypothetical protein
LCVSTLISGLSSHIPNSPPIPALYNSSIVVIASSAMPCFVDDVLRFAFTTAEKIINTENEKTLRSRKTRREIKKNFFIIAELEVFAVRMKVKGADVMNTSQQ